MVRMERAGRKVVDKGQKVPPHRGLRVFMRDLTLTLSDRKDLSSFCAFGNLEAVPSQHLNYCTCSVFCFVLSFCLF